MTDVNKITVNLDALEREQTFEPFRFVLDGREIVMTDPRDIAWQDLEKIQVPSQFAKFCMSVEDRAFFLAQRLPGWKFNALFTAYQQHYGIDTSGNGLGSAI